MRATLKALLVLEVLVCFGPMTLLLLIGALLVPMQIVGLFYEPHWKDAVWAIGQVLSGAVGLATLVYLLGKLLDGAETVDRPLLVLAGAIVGVLPLLEPITSTTLAWRILGAMPVVSGIHIVFLSRRMLFGARRRP